MMGALYLLTLALGWRLARRCNLPLAKEEWLWRGLMLLLAVGPIINDPSNPRVRWAPRKGSSGSGTGYTLPFTRSSRPALAFR